MPSRTLLLLSALALACGQSGGGGETDADASSSDASTSGTTTTDTGEESSSDGEDTTDGETGEPTCPKNVVIMGYWPPTNEMLRQWSQNEDQNPGEWTGQNWRDYGFDVYSFFPEFPPDGDPSNDQIGDEGAVGSPESDLRVDYQDTSEDFWRIVDTYQPVILITTSRGGNIGWEIEALEGGHGDNNQGDPSMDWTSDGWPPDYYPTEQTIDPRSWEAVSEVRQNTTLGSQLPMEEIEAAADALGLTSVEINYGTSGNFLSGFLGLHGLVYNLLADHNVAAGHIHVGINVPVADAEQLIETTLETVLQQYPADSLDCPPDQ